MNIVINKYNERGTHFCRVPKVPRPRKQIKTWFEVEWNQRNKISKATLEKMKRWVCQTPAGIVQFHFALLDYSFAL